MTQTLERLQRRWSPGALLSGLALMALTGCASIPREAPELSAELGGRIKETRSAHVETVRLYMEAKRTQVDKFILDEWLPRFAKDLFSQDVVVRAWEEAAATKDPALRLDFIRQLGTRVQKRLNEKRTELMAPLDEMEREILRRLDENYDEMFAMNGTLTGMLSAGAKASETQGRILRALRGEDELAQALGAVEKATALTTEGVDTYEKRRPEIEKLLQSLKRGVRDGN
jgi:hypothetical protein